MVRPEFISPAFRTVLFFTKNVVLGQSCAVYLYFLLSPVMAGLSCQRTERLKFEDRKEPQSQSEEQGFTFDQGQAEVSFPHGTVS